MGITINTLTKEQFEKIAIGGERGDNVGLLRGIVASGEIKELVCGDEKDAKVKLSALSAVRRKNNFQINIRQVGARLYLSPGGFTARQGKKHGPRKAKEEVTTAVAVTKTAAKK